MVVGSGFGTRRKPLLADRLPLRIPNPEPQTPLAARQNLPRVRVSLGQHLLELGIVSIDVVEEAYLTILQHDGGAVNNQHGNGVVEIHLLGLVTIHRGDDALPGPLGPILQHPDRQSHGILDPDAAVAEIAPRAFKELWGWRAVQIDVVFVGKEEFDEAERILRTRLLPQGKLPGAEP